MDKGLVKGKLKATYRLLQDICYCLARKILQKLLSPFCFFFATAEGNLPFSGEFHSSPFSLALSNSSPCLGNHLTVLEGEVAPEMQDPSRVSKVVLTENKQVHLDSSG